ncbi:hypothetical protein F5X68DRAFT_21037 [Plectosphaerella plurivora]|uniref:Uncharacterized protein n=1 Tax=Plectosphaerella plurivora TaxID=936078 RepID=A0A9P9A8T1_9PEZI|nr:hypothetical protein F5X68DRAFT_21037 [Plectosphaerella plurivora]
MGVSAVPTPTTHRVPAVPGLALEGRSAARRSQLPNRHMAGLLAVPTLAAPRVPALPGLALGESAAHLSTIIPTGQRQPLQHSLTRRRAPSEIRVRLQNSSASAAADIRKHEDTGIRAAPPTWFRWSFSLLFKQIDMDGTSVQVFQHICLSDEFRHWSPEELRLADLQRLEESKRA